MSTLTAEGGLRPRLGTDARRAALLAAAAYVWVRVALILSAVPFETPDTESYRSGEATRPPVSAALLSVLGDRPYVLVSALVSSLGFVALIAALWRPGRRTWSATTAAIVAIVSLLPTVAVYEHWLVPDSLLVGFSLVAVALAGRPLGGRWYPWALVLLCIVITLTKEVGFGVVVLIALVTAVRSSWRTALAAGAICLVLFTTLVVPGSGRQGTVLWSQPEGSELTMDRFRVVSAGLLWPDLSPRLAEVRDRSEACGMSRDQLFFETFRLTDRRVAFVGCDELWASVDALSQIDVLLAHASQPRHVAPSIERGFAADLTAVARWGAAPYGQDALVPLDRWVAAAVSLTPLVVLGVAMVQRRGRRLALVAVLGSAMALAAALVDPGSQDRHTLVFRAVAAAIAVLALADATAPVMRAEEDEAEPADRVPAGTIDGA